MKAERGNYLLYGVILIVLLFAMAVLIWLQEKFAWHSEARVKSFHELFTIDLLKPVGDPIFRSDDWIRLESMVGTHEDGLFFNRIFVTKHPPGPIEPDREVLIYPWYYPGVDPDWRDVLKTLKRKPIFDGGQELGALYLEPCQDLIRNVRFATWGLGAMLALTLIVMASRLWTQQRVISRTTVELAEKRHELIRLERLALAGQLTANIFHDIKKPVLNIKHELVDVEESLKDFAGAIKPLQSIRAQVELFIDMLRDLNLERFVRADDCDAEFVNVNDLLERAVQLVKYEQGDVTVVRRFNEQLPFVFALPYRLIQVFSNIILNAYQAMEGAGQLKLTTRRMDEWVEALIGDSGPGMKAEQLELIFEPFYSTREAAGGSGLGLYISKEIVTIMDGEIGAESSPGRGTTFIIRLPAAAPEDKGRPA
jgi:signal transduction histidine kinase